jgi:hypothetical protein
MSLDANQAQSSSLVFTLEYRLEEIRGKLDLEISTQKLYRIAKVKQLETDQKYQYRRIG